MHGSGHCAVWEFSFLPQSQTTPAMHSRVIQVTLAASQQVAGQQVACNKAVNTPPAYGPLPRAGSAACTSSGTRFFLVNRSSRNDYLS